MDQDATWYGGRPPRLCVRWGPISPYPKGAQPPIFGQCPLWPNGWRRRGTKMPLSMEVGLGPGDFVFDGDPAPPEKGHTHPTQFLAHVNCGQTTGWIMNFTSVPSGIMIHDATWYRGKPRPRPHCIRWGPSSRKRGIAAPLFSAHVYCGHCHPFPLLLSSFCKKHAVFK